MELELHQVAVSNIRIGILSDLPVKAGVAILCGTNASNL